MVNVGGNLVTYIVGLVHASGNLSVHVVNDRVGLVNVSGNLVIVSVIFSVCSVNYSVILITFGQSNPNSFAFDSI